MFRSSHGVASVLDAHCPHLGAHLGHGGVVVGDALVCPFHGWRFDAAGSCVGVPNASIVPNRARLRCWTVAEVNGAVMLWFDAAGGAPGWPAPVVAEAGSAEWTRLRPTPARRVRTHVQELAENGIDLAHFTAIHGRQISRAESAGLTIEGQTLTHLVRNGFAGRISRNTQALGVGRMDERLPGALAFSYHGLGTMVCRAAVAGRFPVAFVTVLYFTPVDDEVVEVRGEVAIRRCGLLTHPLLLIAARETARAVADDTAILEHKRYLSRPQLSDADGPIMQYRRWASQFYASAAVLASAEV